MATAFTDSEKKLIREKLKEAAKSYLGRYGVRRTTVDQLVKKAGISKGSFYNFYDQKEILFFQVLEDYQYSIIKELKKKLKEEDNLGGSMITELIYQLYQNVRGSFIINIIKNQEFDYLIRKLPKEIIKDHHSLDDMLIGEIFSYLEIKEDVDISVINASFRAIFMTILYIEEIGENDYDEVLVMLIRGVVQQIIQED